MIIIVHHKAFRVERILKGKEMLHPSKNLCETFWDMAKNYPEEVLVWVEKEIFDRLTDSGDLARCFDHELIMSSYAVKTKFLCGGIGYIDQLPFVNVRREIRYPTWRMSTDVGGITGKTLLSFQKENIRTEKFSYLLNSIAKLGQQNGLLCYSDPRMVLRHTERRDPVQQAGAQELFAFVYQHYKTIWVFVLLACFVRYESTFPLWAFLNSFFRSKLYKKQVDLSQLHYNAGKNVEKTPTIDVIIPTLGRPEYVREIINDLKKQDLLPTKVIIVEQNPKSGSVTDLSEILKESSSFQIQHIFTHQTGACMARNKALAEVRSQWIFFADDDIRIDSGVLAESLRQLQKLQVGALNLNCKQPGEKTVFQKVKQWGSFGSGTSIVRSDYCDQLYYDEVYEYGYGEDLDFGMRLRNRGCDIVYHPDIVISHLKAPSGGLREVLQQPWQTPDVKPSPTLMIFMHRYYTKKQLKGYRVSLFLRFYLKQNIRNPLVYLKHMRKKWRKSEDWAETIIRRADMRMMNKKIQE